MEEKQTEVIQVRCKPDLKEALVKAADSMRITPTDFARRAIADAVKAVAPAKKP